MDCSSKKSDLIITIRHAEPVEVFNFANTMSAFGSLFSDYCKEHGKSREERKARLYLEKVEHGSIEIHLSEIFTLGMLPFIEAGNTIFDFAGYIKAAYDFFANGTGNRPDLTEATCRNLSKSLEVVANDNNGEMQIYATNDHSKNIYHNCLVVNMNANAAQHRLDKYADQLREEAVKAETRQNVLMTIYQMRSDLSQRSGNLARIDEICDRKVPVRFDNDDLKERILGSTENPFRQAYLVDVEVKTAEGKIAMYYVVKLHDVMSLPD
jgi:hypothetical protein